MLIYCNVNKYGIEDPDKAPKNTSDSQNFIDIEIKENQLTYLLLHKDYKIIAIQEIGNEMSAIVLEDLRTRQVRFLRAFYSEKEKEGSDEMTRRLKLV